MKMFVAMGFGFERKEGIFEYRGGGDTVLTQVLSTYTKPHINTTSESSSPFWADTKCFALLWPF